MASEVLGRKPSHDIKVHGGATLAVVEATAKYYTKQQMPSIDRRALYWKQMPSRTFTAREKSMPGSNALKGTLTNAAGDLKPVLIGHSENPKTLKNNANRSSCRGVVVNESD